MSPAIPKPLKPPKARTQPIKRSGRIAMSGPIARRTRVRQRSRHAEQRQRDDAWWSGRVCEEANGRCERCGGVGTAGHHVFGKKAHPRLRYVLANGVWLCHEDHRAGNDSAHRKPIQFKAWFAQARPESWAELQARLGRTIEPSHQTKETQ